uniref:Uncharacterized protein n=2 Tax=Oryza sativa subsp. japonica TaxID=39947 RepID=A0A5S6R6G6_ORYSJ|nr:Hypothetical protein [Oryza sativa Japonica Group]AAL91608.1 Unknown protein [Oryza sativa Japonica Group]AAP51773.1 hypothetical protein LOC_Os10g01460 [Oryza sativa Japonica Group]
MWRAAVPPEREKRPSERRSAPWAPTTLVAWQHSYPELRLQSPLPKENLAKTLARWREKLRAPGRGLPPADYSYIKIGDVCEENTAVLSSLWELGASEPACVYYGDVAGAQGADLLSLGRLSFSGGAAARHITVPSPS